MSIKIHRSLIGLAMLAAVAAAGCSSHSTPSTHHPATHSQPASGSGGIPQNNGGDHDADNNGGPSDGDGNI